MVKKAHSEEFKVAYIGGGSMFLPSIFNGIAYCMKNKGAFDTCISLYDINAEKAERMKRYADIAVKAMPMRAEVASSRAEALDGARLVFVSVALYDRIREIDHKLEEINARLPESGPGTAIEAVAVAPFYNELAEDIKRYCPDATHISLVNPTDVVALYMGMKGVHAAGMCVEVEGLRGALAYYFRLPEEAIEMTYAGVNHFGWTLKLKIDEKDGYELFRKKLSDIKNDPYFHPGQYSVFRIYELTGYLLSSGYHTPPFHFDSNGGSWDAWDGKRENYEIAIEKALQTGEPITDHPMIHPEKSMVNYPGTGRAIGRMIRAMATKEPSIVPLQVVNNGAVSNFPSKSCVEVPTFVSGNEIIPQQVGELPEWLGGVARLMAIQRMILAEYLMNPSLELLKQSLSALPILAPVERHLRCAEALHEIYTS